MTDPLAVISTRRTPQTQPATPTQVENNAGGYVFQIDDMARLHRFLTIGTTGGTYYVSEKNATFENAQLVLDLARTRTLDVVNAVVTISVAGRAPRQNPGLFALAACAKLGTDEGRKAANAAVPLVARTASTLFTYVKYVEQFGGWGRGTRRAVANWYLNKTPKDLAYQVAKYRQRDGWTHRDLLRVSHPSNKATINRLRGDIRATLASGHFGSGDKVRELEAQLKAVLSNDLAHRQVFDWISGRVGDAPVYPGLELLSAFEQLQKATKVKEVVTLINSRVGVSWEMIPDQFLNEPKVWEALTNMGLPVGALMRQLPRLTRLGLLKPMSIETASVVDKLTDPEQLKRARIHPMNVLVAQRTYSSGHSARGESTWTPSRPIVDALDAAFYAAYGAIEPAGKRTMLALDVSGSMGSHVAGMPISCREASAAISLVTAATEPLTMTVGFTASGNHSGYGYGSRYNRHHTGLTELSISPRQRLDDVISTVNRQDFGATDCALPMIEAKRNGWEIDTFVISTDNETWAGEIHPFQALREYRESSGIDARLVVVGMTASAFSIADPTDRGMLDIAGLDSAVPNLIADFSRGAI